MLKNSRFADLDTVQAAVRWMVSVEHSDESEVQAVARHLAVELRRKEEEPAPKRRKGRMKLDTSLVAGTRQAECPGFSFCFMLKELVKLEK